MPFHLTLLPFGGKVEIKIEVFGFGSDSNETHDRFLILSKDPYAATLHKFQKSSYMKKKYTSEEIIILSKQLSDPELIEKEFLGSKSIEDRRILDSDDLRSSININLYITGIYTFFIKILRCQSQSNQ